VLDADGYIELHRTLGGGIEAMSSFALTTSGTEIYASTFVADYGEIQHRVVSQLVSGPPQGTDEDLAQLTSAPRFLVLHIMQLLDGNGLLKVAEPLGGPAEYFGASPKLRRLLR
jgi:hypothetical protein